MKSTNYAAAAALFFLPAVSVELLTGNTRLSTYFSPILFIILNITYGGALLLIRETVVRWGKGFPSILMFALGYGMLNEALSTKGFFDPHFYSVVSDKLEGFGRVYGINVPWALNITVVHAVFSILVPYLIVTTIFPGRDRWIGNKLYVTLLLALIAVIVFTFLVIALPPSRYHYNEGPGPLLLIIALLAALILAAWKMPSMQFSKWNIWLNAAVLFVLGFLYTVGYMFLPDVVRRLDSAAAYDLFLLVFFFALPILAIIKLPALPPRDTVTLAAGLIFPVMLFGIFAHTPGTLVGVAVVLIVFAAAFVRAGRTLSEPVENGNPHLFGPSAAIPTERNL
jgi:hypothetical protein